MTLLQRSTLIITLVTLGAACDEPVSRIPTGGGTVGPASSGVEISGPATLSPGQSAQFNANIRMADGTLKLAGPGMVTNWRIGSSLYLQVNQAGIATAQPRVGETTISVTVRVGTQARTATREVVILPEGTYRVSGKITEAGFPTQAVGGARVEVPGSVSTTADFGGQYKLYGVPASAVIKISATGYADLEQPVTLSSHTTRNFELDLSGPRPTLSGTYTLAIDAESSCPVGLSPALQHPRYDAFVTQNGPTIEVELTEPRFRLNSLGRGNKFTGRTIGNGAIFTLRPYGVSYLYYYYYYYYFYAGPNSYPDVAERLGDNTFLVIDGQATTSLTGTSLSGALSGQLSNWDSRFPGIPRRLSRCSGTTHQFTLTPR